jgi:hypothetical protein
VDLRGRAQRHALERLGSPERGGFIARQRLLALAGLLAGLCRLCIRTPFILDAYEFRPYGHGALL